MSGRLASIAAAVVILLAAGDSQAQRSGYGSRGYNPARAGYAYPGYLATPYSTYYNYYTEPYRYPQTMMYAPTRMVYDPYGPSYGGRYIVRAPQTIEVAPTPASTTTALIDVSVPAEAEILFDGSKTTQMGTNRVFETPELTPGKEFEYEVTARWQKDGKPIEMKKTVTVRAGERARLDFQQ